MSIRGKGATLTDNVSLFSSPHSQKIHVIYTYSVHWLPSNTTWSNRFDHYSDSHFREETSSIHWYSILNSLLVVLFLSVTLVTLSHPGNGRLHHPPHALPGLRSLQSRFFALID